MNTRLALLLTAALAGLASPRAEAAFISLRADARAQVVSNRVVAGLTLINEGDEAARSVRVAARFLDRTAGSPAQDLLPPGQPLELALDLGAPPEEAGFYPLIFKIHYADANHYPFSALAFHAQSFPEAVPPPPAVLAILQPLSLTDRGTLKLKLKSLLDTPFDLLLRLHLPDELSCETPELNLLLTPGRERQVEFPLVNFSGRPGSRYTLLVVAGYRAGGVYCGLPIVGSVEIRTGRRRCAIGRWSG